MKVESKPEVVVVKQEEAKPAPASTSSESVADCFKKENLPCFGTFEAGQSECVECKFNKECSAAQKK